MIGSSPVRVFTVYLGSCAMLLVLTLIIWIPTLRGENETPGPDPATLPLALGPEDMPSGFVMERAEAAPIRVQVDGRETESDSFQEYRGLYQLWIRPESADHPRASISISYYLLPTNREAGRVLKSILGNYSMIMRRRPVTNPPEVGDTSFGRYPGTTLFIRGRAIISIMIQLAAPLPPDIERSEIAALVDPTVEATVRRLDELGLESRPPLQVDMLVLSRHVNAARKDAVRLRRRVDQGVSPLASHRSGRAR